MKAIKEKNTQQFKDIELYLSQLLKLIPQYEELQQAVDAETQKVVKEFEDQLIKIKDIILTTEKALIKTMKKSKAELFKDKKTRAFKSGTILYSSEYKVKKAKGILQRLEDLGFSDAIIVDKKVDWEKIDGFTDQDLSRIGTGRILKESFEYEIKK